MGFAAAPLMNMRASSYFNTQEYATRCQEDARVSCQSDYGNDGWDDIFVAGGHIEADIERIEKRVSYAKPPHLFHNLGNGRFEEATASGGEAFAAPKSREGLHMRTSTMMVRLILLMTTNGRPAYLFHNEGRTNHNLRIKLEGTKSNHDGIGAIVRLTAANGKQWKMLRSGSSYLSQSGRHGHWVPALIFCFEQLDHVAAGSYSHDRCRWPHDLQWAHNYAWDVEGKMMTVDTTTFTHDALGRMVEKSVSGTITEFQLAIRT